MDGQMKIRCLQGLPDEILLKILNYLPCNFRLASVNRVCHHFKDLIDSIGIKSLDLKVTLPEKENQEMKKNVRNKHSLDGLLRTFLQQLRGQTHISWLPPSYDRFHRLFEQLEQHPKMLKEIRSVCLSVQARSWYISCFQHHRLLHSLPSLDHLTLSPPPASSTSLPMQSPNYRPRALRSLRLGFLPLTAPLYRGNIRKDILKVIDHYRSWVGLRKLRIDGLEWRNGLFVNEGMTSIRDLWCVGCRKCEATITTTQLIRSCTGLVRYVFETDTARSPYRIFGQQYALFLYNDLLVHKRTLRQLVIATSKLGVIHQGWILGPLNTFSQLKKLALPCFMLPESPLDKADYEVLPPKLEELQIEYPFDGYSSEFDNETRSEMFRRRTGPMKSSDDYPLIFDNEARLDMFRRRTSQMKSRLPCLKRFIIWFQGSPIQIAERDSDIFDPATLKTLRVLGHAFEDFDITFEWLAVSSFWDTPVGKALDREGNVIIEESGGAEREPIALHPTSTTV